MGNTRISYMYRDGSNYKYHGSFVVRGEIKFSELEPFLQKDDFTFADQFHFVPQAVGLAHLLTDKWDSTVDHDLHELQEFEETTEDECVCTSHELLDRFRIASKTGWFEYRPK